VRTSSVEAPVSSDSACGRLPPSTGLKAQAAQAHYDRWARVYGRSRLLPSLQKKALAELRPRAGDRLLDVACGAGALVIDVAPYVERAVGIDLSDGMLEIARSRLLAAPDADRLTNIEFALAPSDALPFEDASFTALVCTTALHHFPDPQRSIDEMARVLGPGGRLVIGDASRDSPATKLADPLYQRFEEGHVGLQRKRDIEAMLTRAGLRITRSRHVWLHIYALVGAERPAS
jgi:ubiquinone/menaquinone biosynthesis C-methylase UbiE